MRSLTLSMAFVTPFPKNAWPSSRSSRASFSPVEAPLGTIATDLVPSSNNISVEIVGSPLESRT